MSTFYEDQYFFSYVKKTDLNHCLSKKSYSNLTKEQCFLPSLLFNDGSGMKVCLEKI